MYIDDQPPHSCVTIFVACVYMLVEIVNQTIESRARKLLEEENWVEAGHASSRQAQVQVPRLQAAPLPSSLTNKSSRTPERPYEREYELT